MAKILIAYATTDGQTEKIADYLGKQLGERGHGVTTHRLIKGSTGPSPEGFDVVVLGASVRYDKYQPEFSRYVDSQMEALKRAKAVAFFSVSGAASSTAPEHRSKAQGYMSHFEQTHHWQPAFEASFAGAIKYSRYNPVLRWVMKHISKKSGRDTDTSRDWEYTNWQQVDAFAGQVASVAGPR
jgi:menaquinone-dependent protoporphyrinogen oxidase